MRIAEALAAVALAAGTLVAAEPPRGRIAVSFGEKVALADPASGEVTEVVTGPVGWLYPAPGGVLFAPDLVHARTTVISLADGRVVERLEAVTMPRFARRVADRYVVVAPGRVLVASYPERVVLAEVQVPLARPWRAVVSPEGALAVVLDRGGRGRAPRAVAVDLWEGRVAAVVPLPGRPDDLVLLRRPYLLVVAAGGRVALRDPGTLALTGPVVKAGGATALAALPGGRFAVAAADPPRLEVWRVRVRRGEVRVRRRRTVELAAPPVRVAASPDGRWLAVATASGRLLVLEARRLRPSRELGLPAVPRDVVWADPAAPGPALPEWSG